MPAPRFRLSPYLLIYTLPALLLAVAIGVVNLLSFEMLRQESRQIASGRGEASAC